MASISETGEHSLASRLLSRTLTDPATGLPSGLYFRLIREWEERRAARLGGCVRTVRIEVSGGDERVRRLLPFRLCTEFRTSDLLASDGPDHFLLLLSGRDAERVDVVLERIRRVTAELESQQDAQQPVEIAVRADPEHRGARRDACEAPDESRLDTPASVPRFEPRGE
jgi:hypothetical protein